MAKLGQHFLVNKNVAEKIAAQFFPVNGPIIEIGPGKGILTHFLLKFRQEDNSLTAIELDNSLFYKMKHKYEEVQQFDVLNRDILKIQPDHLFPNERQQFSVIGNVPYYISKEIMDWVIQNHLKIRKGTFMVQKEFADKVMSGGGKEKSNPQSIISAHLFQMEKCFDVQPGSFSPQPKVKSTVFRFEQRTENPHDINTEKFYAFLKQSFMNRRKTLLNNVSGSSNSEQWWEIFETLQINPRVRAEQLTLEQFRSIYSKHYDRA